MPKITKLSADERESAAEKEYSFAKTSDETRIKLPKTIRPKYELPESIRNDLKLAFNLFDSNCSGFIESKELKVAIRALGYEPTKTEISQLVALIDKDKSGRIAFDDFLVLMTKKMCEKDTEIDIKKTFRLFDSDATGKISYANLKRIANELGENLNDEELKEMIEEVDANQDGEVDLDEFIKLMKNSSLS